MLYSWPFQSQDGSLFKQSELFIPSYLLIDLIVKDAHGKAFTNHYHINKVLDIIKGHFYWLKMGSDAYCMVSRDTICHMPRVNYQGIYNLLLDPKGPWNNISIGLIVALPRTTRGSDPTMMIVDHFASIAHLFGCYKVYNTSYVTDLFFKQIKSAIAIILDMDTKFLSHFWRCLWKLMWSKLLFSIACHLQVNA